MNVRLTWDGNRLMMGRIQVGEVQEANVFAGHAARWWLSGRNLHGTVTEGKGFKVRNEVARGECWQAALVALSEAGVTVTP